MSLRIFNAGLCLLVAGCGTGTEDPAAPHAANSDVTKIRDVASRIDCAIDGTNRFARDCTIEKASGSLYVLRHSDGGFQRITLADDGAIDVADGSARPSGRSLPDGRFEPEFASKRYRLPAAL